MTDQAPGASTNTQDKKGIPVWGWVLIGCGGLVVVGFLMFAALGVFAFRKGAELAKEATGVDSFEELGRVIEENPAKFAAETAIRLNPELEIIESDESAGTLTFKNTRTGEEMTLDYENIADGDFSFSNADGEFNVSTADDGSGIVMSGPDGETRIGSTASADDVPGWVPVYPSAETVSSFSTQANETANGMLTLRTADSAQQVVAYFEEWFDDEGWEIPGRSNTTVDGSTFASLAAESKSDGRSLNVGVAEQGDQTQVTIHYIEE